jgi:hypothetical protein
LEKGQTRGAKGSLWESFTNSTKKDASGEVSTKQVTGRFKSIITVETKEESVAYYAKKRELFDGIRTTILELCRQ